MGNEVVRKLPDTGQGLLEFRKAFASKNLNDEVEKVVLSLLSNTTFHALLDATDNSETVEGNIQCDNTKAAEMIRDYARKNGVTLVASAKLASIVTSVNVVLRRYDMDRKSRRNTVGGTVVSQAAE